MFLNPRNRGISYAHAPEKTIFYFGWYKKISIFFLRQQKYAAFCVITWGLGNCEKEEGNDSKKKCHF